MYKGVTSLCVGGRRSVFGRRFEVRDGRCTSRQILEPRLNKIQGSLPLIRVNLATSRRLIFLDRSCHVCWSVRSTPLFVSMDQHVGN